MRIRSELVLSGLMFVGVSLSALSPAAADPGTERKFRAKCASCHGEDGKAATEQGKKMGIGDMSSKAWQAKFTDAQIKTTIANGFKREKEGKKQEMEAFAGKIPDETIDGLVAYVRSLAK